MRVGYEGSGDEGGGLCESGGAREGADETEGAIEGATEGEREGERARRREGEMRQGGEG
jgi:hypothetical protein